MDLGRRVTTITSGAFLLNARDDLYVILRMDPFVTLAIGWGVIGAGLVTILTFYLKGEFGGPAEALEDPETTAAKLKDPGNVEISTATAHVEGALISHDAETVKIAIREQTRSIHATTIRDNSHRLPNAQIRANFASAISRLEREVLALSRRANANLAIGSIIITVGIGAVLYLLTPTAERQSLQEFAIYYAPRLVTLACTEIFGFFFLRMYRANLAEIRFYQNELTTLALHWNAFEAVPGEGQSPAPVVVEQFAKADRNRSFERSKAETSDTTIDAKTVATVLDRVAEIVKNVK